VVVDNYSVHKEARVQAELPALHAADVYLLYLPAYSPELSQIEPVWKDLKYHQLTCRSCEWLGELKTEAERALTRKALELRIAHTKTPAELLSNVVDQVAQADGPSTSAFGNSVPADGTIFPSLKRTPSRSSRTRCGTFTFRHRPWALLTSL